jgi:hypothetical protein
MTNKDKDRAEGFADGVQRGVGVLAGVRSLSYLRGLEKALNNTLQAVRAQIARCEREEYAKALRSEIEAAEGESV